MELYNEAHLSLLQSVQSKWYFLEFCSCFGHKRSSNCVNMERAATSQFERSLSCKFPEWKWFAEEMHVLDMPGDMSP